MQRNFVRIMSLALALVMAIGLCACGKPKTGPFTQKEGDTTVWYMGGNNLFAGDVNVPELFSDAPNTLDAASVYRSLEITEQTLYGGYVRGDMDKDLKEARKEIPLNATQFPDKVLEISALPVAVYFGADQICGPDTLYQYSEFKAVTDREVAVLSFFMAEGLCQVICAYEVSGNTVTFRHIRQDSAEGEAFSYYFTGLEFVYDFSLVGPYITFSSDGLSLKLTAASITKATDGNLSLSAYSLPDSPLISGLDHFVSANAWNYAVSRDGVYYDLSAFKFTEDGKAYIFLQNKDVSGNVTDRYLGEFVYIMQSSTGNLSTPFRLILMDGQNTYYYTDTLTMREARALEDQGVDVTLMAEEEIEVIAEKKADLFDDLHDAFQSQEIPATINRSTGEIALDATVLFAYGESGVSEEGKAFLQKFMQAYTGVVFSDKYDNFVSKIMVEGHTDTTGSYEVNQALSLERADSVKNYCLSAECQLDPAHSQVLQTMMESVGYAYDRPVYDENGQVDMDASRRVSFRFIINTADSDG